MERIDRDAYEMVMRMGLRTKALGTANVHRMKDRESAGKRSTPEFTADSRGVAAREGRGGVQETSLSQWRVIRVRPSLKIADGGKR
jgi:hypothetical protein